MKKFLMAAFAAAAAFAAGAGEEYKFDKAAAWNINIPKNVVQKGDKLVAAGRVMLESKKLFDVNPDKIYELELKARNIGKVPASTYFGFKLYAQNGKTPIWTHNYNTVPKTQTTVVRAVKKGDKVIYLAKNAGSWRKTTSSYIALNAKADYSDLPNFRSYPFSIKSIEKCAEGYKVTLNKGIAVAIAKGTAVRQHITGGYMYAGGWRTISVGKAIELKGKVASATPTPVFSHNAWSKYTPKARLLILANWTAKGGTTEFDDIELEIEDKK